MRRSRGPGRVGQVLMRPMVPALFFSATPAPGPRSLVPSAQGCTDAVGGQSERARPDRPPAPDMDPPVSTHRAVREERLQADDHAGQSLQALDESHERFLTDRL